MTAADPTTTTTDVICLACGCLCDDLTITGRAGRVEAIAPDCALGRAWFHAPHPGEGGPVARTDGRPSELDAALDRAAVILRGARAPLIWGLTESSVEAASLALAIADRLGATVDLAGSGDRATFRASFVRSGLISATLGEVRDRADTILFWGHHPDATHPRHAERYSTRARGRFVAGARTVLVVDVGSDHAGAGTADLRVNVSESQQETALRVILALVRGVSVDETRVEAATGISLATWRDLADRLVAGRWVAVFFGVATSQLGPTGWDRFGALVGALHHDGRRAVGLPLGEPGNVAGAEAALTWQGGAPGSLDFGPGWPDHRPNEASLVVRLAQGTVDAVLSLGPDPSHDQPSSLRRRLAALPVVRIAPDGARSDPARRGPSVGIAVGRLGIEAGGTVARVDGLMLPLAPPLTSQWPDERAVLRGLLDRLTSA